MQLRYGKENSFMEIDNTVWARRGGYRFMRKMRLWFLLSGIIFSLVLLALFIFTLVKRNTLAELKNYEQGLVREVSELDMLNSQKKLLETDGQQLDLRLEKVQKITCADKNNPHQYLRLIEQIIPEHVVLKSFSFNQTIIHLEGFSNTVQEVMKFMRALAKSKIVSLPQLTSLSRHKKNKEQRKNNQELEGKVSFIINATKT